VSPLTQGLRYRAACDKNKDIMCVVNYSENLYKMYTLDILPYNLQVSYVGMSLGAINVLTESSD